MVDFPTFFVLTTLPLHPPTPTSLICGATNKKCNVKYFYSSTHDRSRIVLTSLIAKRVDGFSMDSLVPLLRLMLLPLLEFRRIASFSSMFPTRFSWSVSSVVAPILSLERFTT